MVPFQEHPFFSPQKQSQNKKLTFLGQKANLFENSLFSDPMEEEDEEVIHQRGPRPDTGAGREVMAGGY